jgi:hypothetical protein
MYGVRPVTDSPKYHGDLFLIEVPDTRRPGEYVLHKVSTSIQDHQKHMDGLHEKGHHDFIERKIKSNAL